MVAVKPKYILLDTRHGNAPVSDDATGEPILLDREEINARVQFSNEWTPCRKFIIADTEGNHLFYTFGNGLWTPKKDGGKW